MSKIMSVNAGSSSLKFQLLEMPQEVVLASGVVERIGEETPIYTFKYDGKKITGDLVDGNDHTTAVKTVLDLLLKYEIVKSYDEIKGVGHRIVQGGAYFNDSAVINEDVKAKIKELSQLAPLHNPAHLKGIAAMESVLPNVPSVAVFDTAFHQTMEPEAYMYPVPYEWYTENKVRKYGAHGTSHQYVAYECAKLMNKPIEELKIITCHIGNGASITAVKGGKCVDTSMGLTPLDGIPMGTRSGTLDPTVLSYMQDQKGYSMAELIKILNKESGYKGVSGISNDSRDLEEKYNSDERAKLALDLQYKRIADYIGSYYIYMGGVDAIVFTAGIGENNYHIREDIMNRIAVLGVKVDPVNNAKRGEALLVSTEDSKVKVFVIPTAEELVIARDVVRLTQK